MKKSVVKGNVPLEPAYSRAYQRKPLSQLTIKNNFMFTHVMLDGDNCQDVLRLILDRNIEIIDINDEKSILNNPEYKGIRLDVLAVGEDGTKYDIEMQVAVDSTELRARYYHSNMDMDMLDSGADYEDLPESYVIFICDYDPIGYNSYIYTMETTVREFPEHVYKDGVHTIFLSTVGRNEADTPCEIVNFLKFVKADLAESQGDFKSELVKKLQRSVAKIKRSRALRGEYMTLNDELERRYRSGVKEGRAEGIAEIIFSMHRNGFSVEQIATATGKGVDDVRVILTKKESVFV